MRHIFDFLGTDDVKAIAISYYSCSNNGRDKEPSWGAHIGWNDELSMPEKSMSITEQEYIILRAQGARVDHLKGDQG